MNYDHIVVGGGIMGLMTAYYLQRAGDKVALIERGRLAHESSWAGGGILSPLYPWRYHDAISRLCFWSQQHYPALISELEAETGVDPNHLVNGLLILDTDEQQLARQWAEKFDVDLQIIDHATARQLDPELAEQVIGDHAIWMPQIGQVRNPRLSKALVTYLKQHNVTILEQTEVNQILIDNNCATGVATTEYNLHADSITIACGAWSGLLVQELGISLDIKPVLGQMLLLHAKPGLIKRITLSEDRYVIPRRDGRTLVGSTLEHTGFDKRLTEEAKQSLLNSATTLYPALKLCPVEKHWCGLRPGTDRDTPIISAHPTIKNLFINAGHFRNGVVSAPASCRLITDIILQDQAILDPELYSI